MDYKKLLNEIQVNFYERLDRKTGWGKEEVKREFEAALTETLVEAFEELQNKLKAVK